MQVPELAAACLSCLLHKHLVVSCCLACKETHHENDPTHVACRACRVQRLGGTTVYEAHRVFQGTRVRTWLVDGPNTALLFVCAPHMSRPEQYGVEQHAACAAVSSLLGQDVFVEEVRRREQLPCACASLAPALPCLMVCTTCTCPGTLAAGLRQGG